MTVCIYGGNPVYPGDRQKYYVLLIISTDKNIMCSHYGSMTLWVNKLNTSAHFAVLSYNRYV